MNITKKNKISQIYKLTDYESAVQTEDPQYQIAQKTLLNIIKESLRISHPKILEIGAGSGIFTEKLAHNLPKAKIIVVEPDDEWLNALVKRTSKFKNIHTKLEMIEKYHNSFYDICCASFSIHHISYKRQRQGIENVHQLLKRNGYFIVLDKFIPDFTNEHERRIGLKTYHGYFLSWKKNHHLNKGVEFEKASLKTNLLKQGDYKISSSLFKKLCLEIFEIVKIIKIAPVDIEFGIKETILENLTQGGFSVSKKESNIIKNNLEQKDWGIFIYVLKGR